MLALVSTGPVVRRHSKLVDKEIGIVTSCIGHTLRFHARVLLLDIAPNKT